MATSTPRSVSISAAKLAACSTGERKLRRSRLASPMPCRTQRLPFRSPASKRICWGKPKPSKASRRFVSSRARLSAAPAPIPSAPVRAAAAKPASAPVSSQSTVTPPCSATSASSKDVNLLLPARDLDSLVFSMPTRAPNSVWVRPASLINCRTRSSTPMGTSLKASCSNRNKLRYALPVVPQRR